MDTLSRLIEALKCLPGIGPKSAQRMVFHLLQHKRSRGLHLASCLQEAMSNITNCAQCNNYTNNELCNICSDSNRDTHKICVVEGPAELIAIEQTSAFNGIYYVLMGMISPIDGIGPDEIGLNQLVSLIENTKANEVILALSPTIEGQTTIYIIQETLKSHNVTISQLAHGIPSGSYITFLDSNTISGALRNRELLIT
jgi:recombination protein RecR